MKRAIIVTGVVVATVAGSGSAALALSSASSGSAAGAATPSTTQPSATQPSTTHQTAAKAHQPGLLRGLRSVVQARVVTRGKNGTFVTHDVIVGKVTQVSPTSITVRAADGTSDVYAVNSSTTVVIRANGKGTKGSIGAVHVGDAATVSGTGALGMTAKHVVDRPAQAAPATPSSPTHS